MSKVLVTGGSGFVAGHVIVELLRNGHEVRATLRNLNRADEVKANVRAFNALSIREIRRSCRRRPSDWPR
jgi:dihydroflavonol-4-reductase